MQIKALRGAFLFLAVLLFVRNGEAQSILNFQRVVQGDGASSDIAITNPTAYFADVQLTFYGEDGLPIAAGLVNPVTYHIRPRGQLALNSAVVFGSGKAEGWVQATSATAGLYGAYSNGDFSASLATAEAAVAVTNQVIPYIPNGDAVETEIVLTNPGTRNATPTLTFYDNQGVELRGPDRPMLAAREQWRAKAPRGAAWARIVSNVGVLACVYAVDGASPVAIKAQQVDSATHVAPHFVRDATFQSTLVLTNPNAAAVSVAVVLYNPGRGQASIRQTVEVPGNGTRLLQAADFLGSVAQNVRNGWLAVESDGVPIAATLLFKSDRGWTEAPLETAAMERLLFSQAVLYTRFALVNAGARTAVVDATLSRADGSTIVQQSLSLAPNEKTAKFLADLTPLPENEPLTPGAVFLTLRATAPIYALEIFGDQSGNRFLAAEQPLSFSSAFAANAIVPRPTILKVEPEGEIRPGTRIAILAENLTPDSVILFGGRAVTPKSEPDGWIAVDLPAETESGYVNITVRAAGRDSKPWPLRVAAADGLQRTATIEGRAFYQKVEVTDNGLDLSRVSSVPVRNGLVEVYDPAFEEVVSVSQTDELGRFTVSAPPKTNLVVRVVSRLRDTELKVADNTNGNALYAISKDNLNGVELPSAVLMVDSGRRSGAFNIMEVIQRANDLAEIAEPRFNPPAVTVFWSVRNTNRFGNPQDGQVGTTYFNAASNTAYVLGDRATDSDEFDDAVILHEYAHLLAARYSRDDSPGGAHGVGDVEDPRLAWSEGFANFFSGAVRNDAIYRDSRGPNGAAVLRYDLEENVPAGDLMPGYWSEASVGSLLWDLFDDRAEPGDPVQYSIGSLWAALTDLRAARYVYLPYFLDYLVARNPNDAAAIRSMAAQRRIDYRPSDEPTVAYPFPRPIAFGDPVSGRLDSLTPGRTNLMQSSHYFWFTFTGGPVSIRLEILGLGPAGNPEANDLDLFLFDANGKEIANSIGGSNGEPEAIPNQALPAGAYVLPAGAYVLEVRSFFTKSSTNTLVFNSGLYLVTLSR